MYTITGGGKRDRKYGNSRVEKLNREKFVALKRAVLLSRLGSKRLTSESVQSPALPLQGVDDVHSGDGLPLGMLGVGGRHHG